MAYSNSHSAGQAKSVSALTLGYFFGSFIPERSRSQTIVYRLAGDGLGRAGRTSSLPSSTSTLEQQKSDVTGSHWLRLLAFGLKQKGQAQTIRRRANVPDGCA